MFRPAASVALLLTLFASAQAQQPKSPNVLLIITDDQGYGDIAAHGNQMLQTPNLDSLARQSIRFTNFHVDPTCAETRSALMTGRYSCRVGVWHTVMGRSILRRDEMTMAQAFSDRGYATGMFGKWHLGDNWPYRPHDRGFQQTLYHGGGGVGQTPDYWGNDYFDDTFFRRGKPEPQQGYCTDVWFREAARFIEANKSQPFFCYLATNAPHGPYNVDPKYSQPYREKGVPDQMANFYGMIANIDENIGQLMTKLDEWKLSDDTMVIFMTDNGSAAGTVRGRAAKSSSWNGFNAGMREFKGSQYEGGHRVPCWIRWPGSKWKSNREVDRLVAHFDLFPTFAEICDLESRPDKPFDGRSLKPLLQGEGSWPERTLVVHSQRVDHPEKWRKCSVMTQRWRLVDGKELYDLPSDAGQQQDVAEDNPPVVDELRGFYEKWWSDVSQRFDEYVSIPLGADEANPTTLNCMDWHAPLAAIPWSQSNIAGNPDAEANGFWAVEVAQRGRYEITLRARPAGVDHQMKRGEARVKIGDVEAKCPISDGADSAKIVVELAPGPAKLQTWLKEDGRGERGAFFVDVKRL
jgi:arylsulfatase A-like enzyme